MSDPRSPVTVQKDDVVSEGSVSPSVLVTQNGPVSSPVSSQSSSEPAEIPPVSSPKLEVKVEDHVQDVKIQNPEDLYVWVVEDQDLNQRILLRVLGQARATNKETKQDAKLKIRMGLGAHAALDPIRVYAELEDHLALFPDDKLSRKLLNDLDKEFDNILMIILDNTIKSQTIGLTIAALFRGIDISEGESKLLEEDGYTIKMQTRMKEVIKKKGFHEKLIAMHSNKFEKWNDECAERIKAHALDLGKGNFTPKTVLPALKKAKLSATSRISASIAPNYIFTFTKEVLVLERVAPCSPTSITRSASSTLLPVTTVSEQTRLAVIPEEDSDIGPKPLVRSQTSPISSTRSVGLSLLRDSKEKEHPSLHVEVPPKHPILPHSGSLSSPESDLSVVSSRVSSVPSSRLSSSPSSLSSPASLFSPPPALPTPPILSGSSSENGSDISPTKKSPGSVSPKELESSRDVQPEQLVEVQVAEAEKQKQAGIGLGIQYS